MRRNLNRKGNKKDYGRIERQDNLIMIGCVWILFVSLVAALITVLLLTG